MLRWLGVVNLYLLSSLLLCLGVLLLPCVTFIYWGLGTYPYLFAFAFLFAFAIFLRERRCRREYGVNGAGVDRAGGDRLLLARHGLHVLPLQYAHATSLPPRMKSVLEADPYRHSLSQPWAPW
jgi:hypothetical protein